MPRTAVVWLSSLLVGALTLLAGCTATYCPIEDLTRYPQHLSALINATNADRPLIAPDFQTYLNADYDQRYFSPWQPDQPPLPADQVFWAVTEYGQKTGYGANLQPLLPTEWQALVAAQQIERYPLLDRPAMIVRDTSLRVMPTRRPFFGNPALPGEGYPFDYFQNSAIAVGTPVRVTHVSADGGWYLVEAGFAYGWLPADALAWTDPDFRAAYRTGRYAAVLKDDLTLAAANGEFLAQARVGALFPVAGESDSALPLLVPVRDANGKAALRTALVPTNAAAVKPLPLTAGEMARVADAMLGEPYGWGGLRQDRDCSAALRDLFTPFGVWLPRNSSQQAQETGPLVSLDGLPPEQKEARLLADGRPYTTLVWFPGHIGLYLGPDPADHEPLMLNALWGVRTRGWLGREGRAVVGRLAITSFRPGAERPDVDADGLWARLAGLTTIPKNLDEFLFSPPAPRE